MHPTGEVPLEQNVADQDIRVCEEHRIRVAELLPLRDLRHDAEEHEDTNNIDTKTL